MKLFFNEMKIRYQMKDLLSNVFIKISKHFRSKRPLTLETQRKSIENFFTLSSLTQILFNSYSSSDSSSEPF